MDQVNRRQAREQAFALLFELSFHGEESLQSILNVRDEQDDTPEPDHFAIKLASCVQENLPALDETITAKLKPGWKLSRISRASHIILRLAICELCYFDDIPVGATINEAVELAKTYAEDDAPKFINGMLGAIAREQESDA